MPPEVASETHHAVAPEKFDAPRTERLEGAYRRPVGGDCESSACSGNHWHRDTVLHSRLAERAYRHLVTRWQDIAMTSVFRRMPPALLLLLLTVSNMFAQEAPPLPESVVNLPVATDGLRQPTKFKPAVTIDEVRPHIEFLASEELRGRRGRDAMRAADYLVAEFRKCKLQPLFGDSFAQVIPGPKRADGAETFYGRNVGAWLPGSDPELRDEFVIISAHYDHLGVRDGTVYRGADDNASGTSMMLTLARRFSELTTRPRRSVVFIGFDLEEHLLWGSRWFVAHPPWPIERVKFFMTADMIGR